MRTLSILCTVLVIAVSVVIGSGGGVTAAPFLTPTHLPTAEPTTPTEICQVAVDGINALRSNLSVPEHFTHGLNSMPGESDFDVMEYFTVLDHLSLEEGYTLNYMYTYDGMGGYPSLMAHDGVELDDDYFSHVVLDGSEASYIQAAVLLIMGEQFYLHWHSNYNDFQLVCGDDVLADLLVSMNDFGNPIPADVQQDASELDAEVYVKPDEDAPSVRVVLLGFTKWGGFSRVTFTFDGNQPPETDSEILVPYDCGVMF